MFDDLTQFILVIAIMTALGDHGKMAGTGFQQSTQAV
jgi:hypothetical protein